MLGLDCQIQAARRIWQSRGSRVAETMIKAVHGHVHVHGHGKGVGRGTGRICSHFLVLITVFL